MMDPGWLRWVKRLQAIAQDGLTYTADDDDVAILLVKEPEDGSWSLPGGWADVGESAAEAAVREVREESGYTVRAVRLLSAYDRDRHPHPPIPYHVYKLVFLCEILDEPASQ